ncbi:MAG: ClpXP protease specificity-enhancing factor [Sulfurimicrobium sp.]|nr:ClpXP protease specificity-enhancing factor [Sulfurimicrobium sp.]MDO9191187.1 ClpXP protease specificity-enhancing factor [Sulfurimicrobium sp.]MDP1704991.1 ClpXP protease specificity-enhancing factor [Sulfurimicrobium sp.]MDP2197112.1 ClpXP protease specificity-enhancing factor [Sulfurimicrobium sp.]MDP3688540.1 ClpXP protease specificity-enhancing factor [Sulfurimicrobium sp.]
MADEGISTKPYLIRAIYEWCSDSGFTPYLAVAVDKNCRVPMEFVKEGEIVLNIGASATPNLLIDNHWVGFSARFGGAAREISVPVEAVIGIYAKENGQGLFFGKEEEPKVDDQTDQVSSETEPEPIDPAPKRGKPSLKVVK